MIMDNEKKIQNSEEEIVIRRMMQSGKEQASESLQHRIMHQIETEKALSPQRSNKSTYKRDDLADFRGIFGTMYLLLFILSLTAILFGGPEAILSLQYILTALLIIVILTSFWGLTRLENYLRKKKNR